MKGYECLKISELKMYGLKRTSLGSYINVKTMLGHIDRMRRQERHTEYWQGNLLETDFLIDQDKGWEVNIS